MLRIAFVLLLVAGATGGTRAASAEDLAVADSAAIRAAAIDYVEGWYTGDAERMEGCLHPELAKRILKTDAQGRSQLDSMGAMRLVQYTRAGYGTRTPAEKRIGRITILDVFQNVASVRAEMAGWIDYMHLGKADGRWVIVNVLWERKPE